MCFDGTPPPRKLSKPALTLAHALSWITLVLFLLQVLVIYDTHRYLPWLSQIILVILAGMTFVVFLLLRFVIGMQKF